LGAGAAARGDDDEEEEEEGGGWSVAGRASVTRAAFTSTFSSSLSLHA
jgi:hypothetical protein